MTTKARQGEKDMNTNSQTSPYRPPEGKIPGTETGIEIRKTICSICNPVSHCGIDAYVKDGVVIKVEGTKENPHSAGTLCSKGAANRQYIYHPDRISTPLLKKGGRDSEDFEPISWEKALDVIADRLLKIKEESGPESVAFFAGYSKWMRPYLKRLAHSFGSPNYCTESSTCSQATAVAGKLNYGIPMGKPELNKTRCLMVWSTNPFYSNSSKVRSLLDAREQGLKIIEVGPLLTPVTSIADIHLRIRPGTSGALALGLANVIIEENLIDMDFVENWTEGFEEYRAYVSGFPPSATEEITGVPASLITKAARLFATTKPAAILTGACPTVHHTNGVQNHRAITALVGLTGNFDVAGGNYAVPKSFGAVGNGAVTRETEFVQPRPFEEMAPRVGQDVFPVWCKTTPEAQAVHLPFQIRSKRPYPVRAMLALGLNYRMWPASDFMRESLKMLDFLVDVDLFMTDAARLADLILPACSSFERSELKFYPEKYAIWTRPVIEPLGEARSDADIIFDLAKRLAPDDALMQKGYEACVDWILEPAGLTVEGLKQTPGGRFIEGIKMPPYKKYEKNGFPTPSGKMEFSSSILKDAGQDPIPCYKEPGLSPVSTPDVAKDFPLIFTTGARLPMYIHSRTFRLGWSKGLRPDPMVDLNPKDAEERGITSGDEVSLSTPRGSIQVKANLTEIVPAGVVNMYHGYPQADVNLLIEPDYVDPISAFPGFKSLLCEVKKAT
jgi:anaerobic selenocysteine-containing dehydrogenase